MSKVIAWSYSRLKSFENCPKKFYHISVAKDVKEETSEPMMYGQQVHKALELRIREGKKLPLNLIHLEPIASKFVSASGEKLVEQQLALDVKLQPTGWFDSDVWARSIVDLAIVNGRKALLVDWKTGKVDTDFTQQRVAGVIFFMFFKQVETLELMYYWIKEKKFSSEVLARADAKHVWAPLVKRVAKYTIAHREMNFPPRPSGLCKRHCPVTSCPHNGM